MKITCRSSSAKRWQQAAKWCYAISSYVIVDTVNEHSDELGMKLRYASDKYGPCYGPNKLITVQVTGCRWIFAMKKGILRRERKTLVIYLNRRAKFAFKSLNQCHVNEKRQVFSKSNGVLPSLMTNESNPYSCHLQDGDWVRRDDRVILED